MWSFGGLIKAGAGAPDADRCDPAELEAVPACRRPKGLAEMSGSRLLTYIHVDGIHVPKRTHVHIHAHVRTCIHIYIYKYICMYIDIYIYMYV